MSPTRLNGFFVSAISTLLMTAACGGEGPKGPAGDTGEQGDPGQPGTDGTPGDLGTPGTPGTDGVTGEPGQDGQDGTDARFPPGAGLKFTIQSVDLAASGPPSATVQVTDAAGEPIDLLKEINAGTLTPRLTIAARDATTGVHTSLYANDVTGRSWVDTDGTPKTPALASATQAASSPASGLSAAQVAELWTEVSDGIYTFTWPEAPATAPTLTTVHTVGIFAGRTFEGVSYPASAAYSFTPSTGEAAALREVVADAACNKCHQNLTAHGVRRGVALCTTCHSPQTTDPETANTVDLRVMIHRIHSGVDGYKIVGYRQNVFDFSNVEFAPPTNNVKNCTVCHQGADSERYTVPSRTACGSCHMTVDFPSHMGGQFDDSKCGNCHQKADVERFHSPLYDTTNNVLFVGKKLEITIDDATNVVAGGRPIITFTVNVDGAAADIMVANTIRSLSFTIAGPTTDYSGPGAPAAVGYIRYTAVSNGVAAAGVATTGTAGQFTYTPPDTAATLAADASGTVGVGLEATIRELKSQMTPEGPVERTMDHAVARTAVKYFAVGGGTALARRSLVDNDKCNNCHIDLGMHGTRARKGVELCVMCHNPNAVNAGRVARYETDPMTGEAWSIVPNSIQFAVMIHKIHAGGQFVKGYTLGGMPTASPNVGDPSASSPGPAGTPVKFEGQFPGDLGNCETCHKPGTYRLPSPQNLATKYETWFCSEPTDLDTNNFCGPPTGTTWAETYWAADSSQTKYVLPQKSVCTSCHATPATNAHADLMTLENIESCNVCHGQGRVADPQVVHQRLP